MEERDIKLLNRLEPTVAALVPEYKARRKTPLWMPTDILRGKKEIFRQQWKKLTPELRVMLALNLITEEGLPYFFALLVEHLGFQSAWAIWPRLWVAEEDRHGRFLWLLFWLAEDDDIDLAALERVQHAFLEGEGFWPPWQGPGDILCYAMVQERMTVVSYGEIARRARECEALIVGTGVGIIRGDEIGHGRSYTTLVAEMFKIDVDYALASFYRALRRFGMPGKNALCFDDMSYVARRLGVLTNTSLVEIVEECIEELGIKDIVPETEEGEESKKQVLGLPALYRRAARPLDEPRTIQFPFLRQPLTI